MKFEKTEVHGFEASFRGLRNPLESWAKSDSKFGYVVNCMKCPYKGCECEALECVSLGKNDLELAHKLIYGGTEHRKFLRQIQVWVDITAPLYWWKEFDTYKVGTVANSTSTMHKLMSKPITRESFELDGNYPLTEGMIIDVCEQGRQRYLETDDPEIKKDLFRSLVQLLPCAWLQTRTVTMNYENLRTMYHQRKNHKLKEWSEAFIGWVESLPYAKELIVED